MTTENKQRLTMLTRKEVAAADTGGVLDERIDEQRLRKILRDAGRDRDDNPIEFDAAPILDVLMERVGLYRMLERHEGIPQSEITKQARDTAAVIDELMTRLMNMHPDVYARACAWMLKQKKEMAHAVMRRVLGEDLMWMKLALESAADAMPEGKGGRPSEGERDTAYRAVYAALFANCRQRLTKKLAQTVARDLLVGCGVPVPAGEKEQREIIQAGKNGGKTPAKSPY